MPTWRSQLFCFLFFIVLLNYPAYYHKVINFCTRFGSKLDCKDLCMIINNLTSLSQHGLDAASSCFIMYTWLPYSSSYSVYIFVTLAVHVDQPCFHALSGGLHTNVDSTTATGGECRVQPWTTPVATTRQFQCQRCEQ